MKYLISFSYDGSNFNGYQSQDNYRTVEGEIERVLKEINNDRSIKIVSSGRTDKGVHAKDQKAHFELSITNITEYKLKCAMNSKLPLDIHVNEVNIVDKDFHARYMVSLKEYKYYLNMGEFNPIERNYVFQYNKELDYNLMKESIKDFIGEHDFTSFTPTKDKRDNCVRTINEAYIEKKDNILIFTFKGTGFIKYQVRNMVGYLIKIGEHKKDPNSIKNVLEKKNRIEASITAHPEGLVLEKVEFKDEYKSLIK